MEIKKDYEFNILIQHSHLHYSILHSDKNKNTDKQNKYTCTIKHTFV